MAEIITDAILDDFETITLYDISAFFSKYINFIDTKYSNIVNYYSGFTDVSPVDSLKSLANLISEHKKLVDIIILNSSSFNNYEFWILVEYVEDIGLALETANNASKWIRSAVTKSGNKQQVVVDLVMSQGQKIEDVDRDNLKSNDPDSWVQTALDNGLREEDYDMNGGALIKVVYKNNTSLFLAGVVDNIDSAEKTYGLDIDKNITITDDDLVVLSYRDTFIQSMKILTDLKRGDDPSFPDRGVDVKNILGGNVAGISYPIIFRQLADNFATDDGFKSFSMTDVKRQQDAVYIEFQVESRAGEVFSDMIQV